MSNDGSVVKFTFFVVFGFFMLLLTVISLLSIPLRTKASANVLSLRIKLQGTHKTFDQIKSRVDFYNGPQKATSEAAVSFTYGDGVYTGNIALQPDFDFTKFYALNIKPEKYIGRVFCSSTITGTACNTPQMIFLTSGSTVDFSSVVFMGGDIPPGNGKVDAQDLSLIMKNLGKTATPTTDINGDGITDVVDYSLAIYSLSHNAADDVVSLQENNPSPTPSPGIMATTAPTVTGAPTPTTKPSATPVPSATPGPTSTPIPIPKGVCHLIPGSLGKTMCNIPEEDLTASADWTACTDSGGSGFCAGKSKAKCTCANEMVCSCQLLDQATQTVNCTNGGKIEIQECK